eukprot:Pgem_evm1s4482
MMFSKIVGSILLAASAASALSTNTINTTNTTGHNHSTWQCVRNSNYRGAHSDQGYTDNFCQDYYCLSDSANPTKYPAPGCYYNGFTSSKEKDYKQCLCNDSHGSAGGHDHHHHRTNGKPAPPTPSPTGNRTPNRHAQHHSRVPITTEAHTKQQNNNNNWQCVHNPNYHGRHSDKGYTDNF